MKTNFYFVRHGEVYNPKNIWYGRLPRYGLSEKGKRQAAETADFLKSQGIHRLYSSHQLRARQTARIINKTLALPRTQFSKNLLEIKSSLQGSKFAYVKSLNYNVFPSTNNTIKGETIEMVLTRMQRFIKGVTTSHSGKNIVAISHGDPIMLLRIWIEGLPIINRSLRPGPEKYIKHGEIYLFQFDKNKFVNFKSVFAPKV